MKMLEFELKGAVYQTMSKEYLLSKVDELLNKAHSIEDRNEISRLRAIVDKY